MACELFDKECVISNDNEPVGRPRPPARSIGVGNYQKVFSGFMMLLII